MFRGQYFTAVVSDLWLLQSFCFCFCSLSLVGEVVQCNVPDRVDSIFLKALSEQVFSEWQLCALGTHGSSDLCSTPAQ